MRTTAHGGHVGRTEVSFCTGGTEQIVLDQLKAKTRWDFGGDVLKLAEQANSLGIKEINSPAHRPSAQEALKELNAL